MKTVSLFLSGLLWVCSASGEETLRELKWSELKSSGQLLAGEVVMVTDGERGEALFVESSESTPTTLTLTRIENPGIRKDQYALAGQVRYIGVAPGSYLETLNKIPGQGEFFTRTLSPSGPMGLLEGESDWRPVSLPFTLTADAPRPTKITLNLCLRGPGKVWLSPFNLIELENMEEVRATPGEWWTERRGGYVGALIGILGGFYGILGGLAGWLASKGQARRFAFALLASMVAVGAFSLLATLVALGLSQPYHVWHPLALSGLLFTVIGLAMFPTLRGRYVEAEMRKMKAMDGI